MGIGEILPAKIPADLKKKGIYLSPNSDPFALRAKDIAHEILARFLPQGVPFLLITKNQIPQKTITLLAKYPSQVYVQVSISRLDGVLNAYIEPGAATAHERLKTIDQLSRAGIRVTPILMPLFPMIDDNEEKLSKLIHACADAGAKYLKAAYVIVNTEDNIQMQKLITHPLLSQSLAQMTERVKIHIGGGITPPKRQRMMLYSQLTTLCENHGIKFQSCPILDPLVLEENNVTICATYCKRN
jgi:DNA repair photolyase